MTATITELEVLNSPSPVARRRLLALTLPLAAGLLLVGQALMPKGLDHLISASRAAKELPIATAHSGRLYAANLLVVFGLGVLGVSFAAIATLVQRRGAVVAAVAGLIGGFAGFCGAIVNILIGYDLAAAAVAHTSRPAATQVLISANRGAAFDVLLVGYLGGVVVATVLIGIALWRSRAVPVWLTVLFVATVALAGSAPAGPVSVPLQLPFTAVAVALAVRIRRGSGGQQDR